LGKLVIVAIGGNSLIRDEAHKSVEDQYDAVCRTASHVAGIIEQGYDVVVTHGNGPQVGFILRRSDIANEVAHMHRVPLVICGADTQGAIGYQIQQALDNEFKRRSMKKSAVTIITQVVVAADDPAFVNPAKPIGSFYTEEQAATLRREHPDWVLTSDAGRGYRRLVASPRPCRIIEKSVIRKLASDGYCVIAVGGGGIPVTEQPDGTLRGIDAVIDKDLASQINADTLVISTAVPKVCLNYGQPDQRELDQVHVSELKQYVLQNQFAPGSMLPKIQAVIEFLERGGTKAIVTSPDLLEEAVAGRTGTHILA
jgi:carbamate kinase